MTLFTMPILIRDKITQPNGSHLLGRQNAIVALYDYRKYIGDSGIFCYLININKLLEKKESKTQKSNL